MTNRLYWDEKLDANMRRDQRTSRALSSAGWTVIRIWEHEDAAAAAKRVLGAIKRVDTNS
jgi:DNA mismatch endonuclease (patch repair protein)